MSDRYPGGLIRKTPPTITPPVDGEGGSAPGIWTLEQASYYQGTGEWPKGILPRRLYYTGTASFQSPTDGGPPSSSPVLIGADINWSSITNNVGTGGATKSDGTLWMWGENNDGQLGIGNIINKSSPTQVGSLTEWDSVNHTGDHVFALKTSGILWAFGAGGSGRLGINSVISHSSPVQVGGSVWLVASAGYSHSAGVRDTGALYTWGSGTRGCLGQNDTSISRSSPTQVGSLTTWSTVTAGYFATAAIKTDGTLWTWGYNDYSILGNNLSPVFDQSSPVQVGALTNWSEVYMGSRFGNNMLALKTDGTLWSWGRNDTGQLGDGTKTDRSSPVQIGALSNWAKGSVGQTGCSAIKTDGTAWAWGANAGAFGNNSTDEASSPVQIGTDTNWEKIARGQESTLFIKKG
jgi:alpha-tubulin suppressor-like RCC1 family protein